MNILILDTGKEWGGGTNSLIELLKRADKNRYRFSTLFYTNYKKGEESDIQREIEQLGIKFYLLEQEKEPWQAKILKEFIRAFFFFHGKLKRYGVFWIDYIYRIKRAAKKIGEILTEQGIHLIYLNNQPSSNLEGILAARAAGIPALQHCRSIAQLNPFESRWANAGVKKMICVSHAVKENFVRQGMDSSKCIVVYNGIDPEMKPRLPIAAIKNKWGIAEGEILVGTVGSLLRRKQISILIEALSILSDPAKEKMKCLILGEGPERKNLAKLVETLSLAQKVILAGFDSQALSYIQAMDIFVLPSEQEGFPRTILEAMLMEKPVVAGNVPGVAELVVDGQTGMLVDSRKPQAFAAAILTLIENPELRRQMGKRARNLVMEKYTIERYVRGVEEVISEVVAS